MFSHTRKSFKFICSCGRCKINMRKNVDPSIRDYSRGPDKGYVDRAGTFIHVTNPVPLILLVQSYDWKWGPPKGKIEDGETPRQCAIRETTEETGLDVSGLINSFRRATLNRKWNMYDVELKQPRYNLPQCDEITGIGWFSIDCIIKNKSLVNHPCKLCLRRFMHVNI